MTKNYEKIIATIVQEYTAQDEIFQGVLNQLDICLEQKEKILESELKDLRATYLAGFREIWSKYMDFIDLLYKTELLAHEEIKGLDKINNSLFHSFKLSVRHEYSRMKTRIE